MQPDFRMDLKSRINKHFTDSAHLKLQAMALLADPLTRASERMAQCLMNEGKILSCGNGGSAAEPPLPQLMIFPSFLRHCTMRSAAAAMGRASASMACSLRCADSEKFSLMRVMRST